jgi:transcription-repair coupling factor (superfamily II helicase)
MDFEAPRRKLGGMSAPLRTASLAENDRRYLVDNIRAGRECSVQPLPLSAQAHLAWALWDTLHTPLVWVLDGPRHLDLFLRDFSALTEGHILPLASFPPLETLPGRPTHPNPELAGERLRTLQECMSDPPPAVIATTIQALLQKTVAPSDLARDSIHLSVGSDQDPELLVAKLEGCGYEFTAEVQARGQASVRGGLLDIWPAAETWPVRVEFFGPVVDSIRFFSPVEQRSIERLSTVCLSLPTEGQTGAGPTGELAAYLPHETCWVWSDPESIRHHAELYRESFEDEAERDHVPTYEMLGPRMAGAFAPGRLTIGSDAGHPEDTRMLDLQPCDTLPHLRDGIMQPEVLDEARRAYLQHMEDKARDGWDVHLFFNTDGTAERFAEMHKDRPALLKRVRVGTLSQGYACEALRLLVAAESDIYGRPKGPSTRAARTGRRRPADAAGQRLTDWTDIQPGDFVVHLDHGIGRYLGLYEIEFSGRQQETMAIEYANAAKLYVPVAQAHLLTRYVGVGRSQPKLHTLGGRKWNRDRGVAERSIRDLAASLLETQALRDLERGEACPPDAPWQHEFERAFPYTETADQERAIREIKEDMESRRPMDRLVCGDVGYGKTEVAMRAAFKVITHGRQVAVLVPTTVLAQQHFDTFCERMEAFPVRVDMLSRFQTRAEQRAVLARVREGITDIVIGTHRLIQPDVTFRDLGLLVIDEEQRFGVEQKEALKQLRTSIDVLTLTATPIPRTLYMSLTGARDMSTIQTPPLERLPIETIVTENTDEVVRDAIIRELNRDGQVFFLHNRVKTIENIRQRLVRLVPEARIDVAHGQMPEKELADVMHRFTRGEFDVLLCTTIIESGVDIPNVNTILIDRADRFGLSELYQLRGRVGRYKHKAYAYLLLPKHARLFDTARKRISAIRRYSSLGAGFKLALRDLEIRGAGNLLGSEQSGHITAVGFDLYCQLLKRTVARMRGEEVPPIIDVELTLDFIDLATGSADGDRSAVIPVNYIEDENLRVQAYRKLAGAASEQELEQLREEFRDRFGPAPEALDRLLQVALLRILAAYRDIVDIEVRGAKLMLKRGTEYIRDGHIFPRLTNHSPADKLEEMIGIVRAVAADENEKDE